jgi:diguanylate cyclase (GGDEF)-like protein
VLSHDATCAEVRRLFRGDPRRTGVLVVGRDGVGLVDRAAFDAATATSGDAELHERHAHQVAEHSPLTLPHDMDLLDASQHLLERGGSALYEDLVVVGPGSELRLVPVARVLAELARLYRHQARHDVLTGLPNRALVLERLTAMLSRTERHGGLVGVMFMDLDGFKRVNDTHGHQAGDHLLLQVAARLRDAARAHDVVGRLGGDEFVVVAEVATTEDLPGLSARLVDAIDEPFPLPGGPAVRVRASVGVAADDGTRPADELLRLADDAMYAAKRAPATGVAFSGRSPHQPPPSAAEDRALARMLRRALDLDELRLAFQPIVDVRSLAVQRVEALARMPLPDGDAVPPDRFVEVAERADLIDELGRWVLTTALAQLATWDARLGPDAPRGISVNLSPRQCHDPHLRREVLAALDATGVAADRLWLEVTESTLAPDDPGLTRTLRELKEAGVHLAIDDFGMGTSTLSRLAQLPVDELKIDRSFVSGFVTEKAQRQVVRMIVGLGRELDLSVVGEGVETDEQLRLLRLLGSQLAQGYRFGRPMWSDDLVHHLGRTAG